MASTNQSPQYQAAQARFLTAQTNQDKLEALEEMIRECPKHKSSENMLANLKTRYKKLKQQLEKSSKKKGTSKQGIKKQDMQAVIISKTNTGKSSLLKFLTNTKPKISEFPFTTQKPEIGMANINGTQIQLIENPAIESEYYNKGLTNSADTLLILITNLEQLKEIEKQITNSNAKKIIVFNKADKLSEKEKRKIESTLKSKKYNFTLLSTTTKENIKELKNKLFQSFNKIRIYTKEPGKDPDKNKPLILEPESTVKKAAEKILHGFSEKIKQTKIWGPSSKFPGQVVGLQHKLKDLDIIEFRTK